MLGSAVFTGGGVGIVGVGAAPAPRTMSTVAPNGESATVVIDTPPAGSANVRPRASGASPKLEVDGDMSSSPVTFDPVVPAMPRYRIETPFATGSPEENVSKRPSGWRNSRLSDEPSLRVTFSSCGAVASSPSAGARVYVPVEVTSCAEVSHVRL